MYRISTATNFKQMKKYVLIFGMLVATLAAIAEGDQSPRNRYQTTRTDTVIIEFGNASKLVIYANSAADLKDLEDYDINQMISELNLSIDSADNDINYLSISDESGTRYLKDTVISLDRTGETVIAANENNDGETGDLNYYGIDDYADDEDDFDYVFKSRRRNVRTRGTFNIEIGMNNWLENGSFPDINNEPYSVKPWGSWYFGFGWVNHTPVSGPLFINWGGNISWYSWKMENRAVRITKTDTQTTFVEDLTVIGKKSKLSATYINATLVPMLDFSYAKKSVANSKNGKRKVTRYKRKGFRIGVGMYAGYRIDSWTKFVFEENGDKETDKEHGNYFINNWRYGLRGQLGYKGMDFFFNYDLNTVFAKGRGPELNAISFGFIL